MVDVSVVFDEVDVPGHLRLRPGFNLLNGISGFQRRFPNTTTLEEDLLTVCSSVFGADLSIPRGKREQFLRAINLTIPVVNLARFNEIKQDLEYVLGFLSNDAWTINFIQRQGAIEPKVDWRSDGDGTVLLFSGGLDSLAAALKYGEEGQNVQLVSHVTANPAVRKSQKALVEYLEEHFPGQFDHLPIRVSGRTFRGFTFPGDGEREETQRTRSFVFLTLAALTARRRKFHRVVVLAENGQMAIHLPLTAARISAFSTHTAHPHFIAEIAPLYSRLLDFDIAIENPFLYSTKKEVVENTVRSHVSTLNSAISCWKASRVSGRKSHCGICVPCLVRRIAIEANGFKVDEYKRDIFEEDVASLSTSDDGKRNIMDLAEFVGFFEEDRSVDEVLCTFPELANSPIDSMVATAMYRRFARESREVFERYPRIAEVLR